MLYHRQKQWYCKLKKKIILQLTEKRVGFCLF
jgi:hypothetical protein